MRKSYIILYTKDNINYIFNRSVNWETYINNEILEVLKTIGFNIDNFDDFLQNMTIINNNIENIENYTNNNFRILKIIDNMPNINGSDQKELNIIKKHFCEKFNAVDRIDKIPLDNEIFNITYINSKIWIYINNIYNAIHCLRKYVNEPYERELTKIKGEIYYKNNQLINLSNEINDKILKINTLQEKINKLTEFQDKIEKNKIKLIGKN